MKKILIITLAAAVLLATLLIGCQAEKPEGMANISIPSHVEIYPPDYSIGVYSDSACTQTIKSFEWGNMANSQSKTVEVYVRAEGNQPVIIAAASSLSPDFGFVTGSPLALSPGQSGLLTITLTTNDEVNVVVSDFRIYIRGCKN